MSKMKECKCGKEFAVTGKYHKYCSTNCQSKYNRIDGHFTVYYLPEEHYVGMTDALLERMRKHRYKHKRITEGVETLGKFECPIQAHLFETMLHLRGYNGFRY